MEFVGKKTKSRGTEGNESSDLLSVWSRLWLDVMSVRICFLFKSFQLVMRVV